jgi:hypothetical protein
MNLAIYQPLIIAFGVVVLAALGNTALEWYRQTSSNRHAAVVLRRALLEELRLARDTAQLNSTRTDSSAQGGSFIVPVWEQYRIYDANITQLGRLRAAEVSAVVRAYAMLRAQIEALAVIGTFHRPEGVILQALVDGKWSSVLAKLNSDVALAVSDAIDVLEGNAPPNRFSSKAATLRKSPEDSSF